MSIFNPSANRPCACPSCGRNDEYVEFSNYHGSAVKNECLEIYHRCFDCNVEWTEKYKFEKIVEIDRPVYEEIGDCD